MKKNFLFSMAVVFFLSSCHREGQSGELLLVVSPKHHEQPIKGATVYVRYGAKELAGTSPSDFDLAVPGDSVSASVEVKNLRRGDYFLYAVGYDSTIAQVVSGGMHVKLKGKTGETDIDLAVTE